ncbi:hypothetical protein HK101_001667 [Irineochytrium annulatum]|nr:hypothetical protein HK101_001667 [Irineochytrium annulatum]
MAVAAEYGGDGQPTDDPCSRIASPSTNFTVAAGDAVLACYSFTVSRDDRIHQIEALKPYFDVYPFLDYAYSASTPLIPSHVDIFAKLDAIAEDDGIMLELDLHAKIIEAIATLYDPHASYNPKCFNQARFFQPWVVSSWYDRQASYHMKRDKIVTKIVLRELVTGGSPFFLSGRVTDDLDALAAARAAEVLSFWSSSGINPADYVGWEVVEIDDAPALDHVRSFGDYMGFSKTPDARMNIALASYQWVDLGPPADGFSSPSFSLLDGYLFHRPSYYLRTDQTGGSATMRYRLRAPDGSREEVLDVPWAGVITDGPTHASMAQGAGAYYDAFCTSKGDDGGKGFKLRAAHWLESERVVKGSAAAAPLFRERVSPDVKFGEGMVAGVKEKAAGAAGAPPRKKYRSKKYQKLSSDAMHPLAYYANGAVYNLDGITGVWLFSSVTPPIRNDTTVEDYALWLLGAVSALNTLKNQGVKNLIIDVTSNIGGIVCLGLALVKYVLSTDDLVQPEYDVVLSDTVRGVLAGEQSNDSIFSFEGMTALDDGPLSELIDEESSDGRSLRFHQNCANLLDAMSDPTKVTPLNGRFEGVAIVSNGLCGSTCATFARVLRDQYDVTSFTYGGASNRPYQPTSFEGGAIATFDEILATVEEARNNDGDLPPVLDYFEKLPLPAAGTLPVHAAYSPMGPLADYPSEFVGEPSDGHVIVEDPLDAFAIWGKVAEAMGW